MPPRGNTTTRTPRVKTAKIGRFDGELHEIAFNTGENIQVLLDKANLQAGKGVEINDEKGDTVLPTTTARNNATYYLTGNYENGSQ